MRRALRPLRLCALILFLASCTRSYYRKDADAETYKATAEHMVDPHWKLPSVSINPPPESRLHDPFDPDCPPMPPDDLAAHPYMHCADGHKGYKHWHNSGDAPWIEAPEWRDSLNLGEDGVLVLTPERAVELGLLHSREYQTALEELYSSALSLTLDRFEFDVHWFGRNTTTYTHFGNSSLPIESNTLTTDTNLGFTKALTTGGQLLVDFANTYVWEYTGPDTYTVTSNIGIQLIQPLLRRAAREVRMERLTQAERNLLYEIRDFARFRKEFYVDLTTSGGFLSLLLRVQSIRNQEANLKTLEQNLRLHEALYAMGNVSLIQVDQVFQRHQQARLGLLQAQTNLDNALDEFKDVLGLPPNIPVRLNDSILAPFQLNDPSVTALEDEINKLLAEYRVLNVAPPLEKLKDGFARLKAFHGQMVKLLDQIEAERERWKKEIGDPKATDETGARAKRLNEDIDKQLIELRDKDLKELAEEIGKSEAALAENTRTAGWEALQRHSRDQITTVGQIFVIQTQIRVHLIRLKPIGYELAQATEFARGHRLDLMNEQARVVDAWRKIAVAADGLEADLDVVLNADIRTKADATRPFDFAASNSTYKVGVRIDSPLNRKEERNIYRGSLVNYQRARRAYMARGDTIEQAVRRDLRQLETERLNFEIARQSLIAAARQVEAARDRLLFTERAAETTTTQDILDALDTLLQAKNTLIGSWVNYEAGRIQLLLDIEALQLDERGLAIDEHNLTTDLPTFESICPPGP